MAIIPTNRRITWTPGVTVGVPGGIGQYASRNTLLNVKNSPYFAAGVNTTTTGTISNGSTSLVVADASSFSVGNYITVGNRYIEEMEILTGCTSTTAPGNAYKVVIAGREISFVDLVSGDSASVVASKMRAAYVPGHDMSGSGTTVRFTSRIHGTFAGGFQYDSSKGVTSTFTTISAGARIVHEGRITVKDGNTLTLDTAASAAGTDAFVTHNDAPSINAAIVAATTNQVIYIPTGTYRFDSSITVSHTKANISVRGDGMDSTIIDYCAGSGSAFYIGGDSESPYTFQPTAITGSPSKGATTISIASFSTMDLYTNTGSGAGVGRLAIITVLNDQDLPVVNVAGYERQRSQVVKITGRNDGGGTISFEPALMMDLPIGRVPQIVFINAVASGIGIEDLAINAQHSSTPASLIGMSQVQSCWFKNIRSSLAPNYLMAIGLGVFNEVRGCELLSRQSVGTNGAGLLAGLACSYLVEDNIITDIFPHLEINASSAGNVFAYNFCEGNNVFGVMGASIDSNHGPHNHYNLYEGNVSSKFQTDGYFGGESEATLFRNWFHGTSDTTDQFGVCVALNRFARNFNVVGNILGRRAGDTYFGAPATWSLNNYYTGEGGWGGTGYAERYIYNFGLPFMGSGGNNGTFAPPWNNGARISGAVTVTIVSGVATSSAPFFIDGDVYLHIDNDSGTLGAGENRNISSFISSTQVNVSGGNIGPVVFIVAPGANGFSGIDRGVFPIGAVDDAGYGTTLTLANYNYFDNSIPTVEVTAEVVPDSLYQSAKPDWFGSLEWPPFDSSSPGVPTYANIPAGYRYMNDGLTDYLGGISSTVFSPVAGTYNSTQNVTITCPTADVDIYYTTDGTTPNATKTLYTGPVEITATTTLKAIAILDAESGAVRTGVYTITSGTTNARVCAALYY